jgi:glucose-6-phosphate dehydrogenase assembly protein OpcA
MAQDVAAIERIEMEPLPVDPRDVEAEFTRIWRETAAGGFDASSIRLRVLNLVGIAAGADALDRFEEVMRSMPVRLPCRGILAQVDAEAERVTALLSAHCWRSAGGARHVCCEQVVLSGPPQDETALASGVLGLLVPELPVAVWLMGEADQVAYVTDEVLDAATRVVFDSDGMRDAARTLNRMLRARADHDLRLADLAWGRLVGWRDLVAQFFDAPDALDQLDTIRAVRIAGAPETRTGALLLAGWLMSSLDLTLADVAVAEGGGLRATLYGSTRAVTLSVEEAAGCGSEVCELSIEMGGAALRLSRQASGCVRIDEAWADGTSDRTVEGMSEDEPVVVARMLDDEGDEVYVEAARVALSLVSATAPETP